MTKRGHDIQAALAAQTLGAPYATGQASGALSASSFLVLSTDGNLAAERVLTAGAGLTGTDGGAGGAYTLAVGAGAGITVNADDVALTTPGTLTVSTSNAAAGSHTHAITTSSNPGAAARILASDASGQLTLVNLLANTTTFNLVNATATTVNAFGAATTMTLGPSSGSAVLQPGAGYVTDIGTLARKWKSIYAAELWVETLVAQDTIATTGGRILVGPTTSLIADLASGGTTMDVKHNNLTSGDRVFMQANGFFEAIAVTSAPTTITGGFRYSITRNLDGTGANDWAAGDAVFNTGTTGNGFLDLYSLYSSVADVPDYVYSMDASLSSTPWETGIFGADHHNDASWQVLGDFALTAVGGSTYFGVASTKWNNLYFNITTAGVYTATLVWEFWNGSAWTSFVPTKVGNAAGNFKATGWQGFEWTQASLTSWATRSINSITAYWVRVRVSAYTSTTTYPAQTAHRVYRSAGNVGPTIVIWKRNSSTWNDLTETVALGNMAGHFGVTTAAPGIGIGDYTNSNYLRYDTSGGFKLAAGGGAVLVNSAGIGVSSNGGTDVLSFYVDNTFANVIGVVRGDVVSTTANLRLMGRGYAGAVNGAVELDAQDSAVSTTPVFSLVAANSGAKSNASFYDATGAFKGVTVGAAVAPGSQAAMLDVRGTGLFSSALTATAGINIGGASGAAANELWLGDTNTSSVIRMVEVPTTYIGGFIQYDASGNVFNIGVHNSSDTTAGNDVNAIQIARASGDLSLIGNVTMADAKNIVLNTTTGTKIGTGATQKLGFYGHTPVVQAAAPTTLADVIAIIRGNGLSA